MKILIITILLFIPFGLFSSPSEMMNTKWSYITGNNVYIRKEPGRNSEIITSFCAGKNVEVLEKLNEETINNTTENWIKIKYNSPFDGYKSEYFGYVFGQYIKHPSQFHNIKLDKPMITEGCMGDGCWTNIYLTNKHYYSRFYSCYPDGCTKPDFVNSCSDPKKIIKNINYCVSKKYIEDKKTNELYEFNKVRFLFNGKSITETFSLDEAGKWQISTFFYGSNNCIHQDI